MFWAVKTVYGSMRKELCVRELAVVQKCLGGWGGEGQQMVTGEVGDLLGLDQKGLACCLRAWILPEPVRALSGSSVGSHHCSARPTSMGTTPPWLTAEQHLAHSICSVKPEPMNELPPLGALGGPLCRAVAGLELAVLEAGLPLRKPPR